MGYQVIEDGLSGYQRYGRKGCYNESYAIITSSTGNPSRYISDLSTINCTKSYTPGGDALGVELFTSVTAASPAGSSSSPEPQHIVRSESIRTSFCIFFPLIVYDFVIVIPFHGWCI